MPARKDFVEWFTKKFPHSCIDSDHARSCLAGWNAAEEKLTAHNSKSMPCQKCSNLIKDVWLFCPQCGHEVNW